MGGRWRVHNGANGDRGEINNGDWGKEGMNEGKRRVGKGFGVLKWNDSFALI